MLWSKLIASGCQKPLDQDGYFHPDLIVFGGGLSVLGQPFIDQIRDRADARSLPFLSAHCRLTLARLGNDAGMIGAGLAALTP
jgi:glucokinase